MRAGWRQTSGEVQNAQRRAAIATSLRHSGHFFVVGSGGASPRRMRAMSEFTGSTTKKYTAAATITNAITAFRKSPTSNLLPFTVRPIAEKSGFPATAAMSGVNRSLTKAFTTDVNAAPITTATARSRTLPRRMNCLNPLNIETLLWKGQSLSPSRVLSRSGVRGRAERQRRQRLLDRRALRVEPRRQHERLAQVRRVLVDGEARSVGGELEQHATRLPEVDRLEPE